MTAPSTTAAPAAAQPTDTGAPIRFDLAAALKDSLEIRRDRFRIVDPDPRLQDRPDRRRHFPAAALGTGGDLRRHHLRRRLLQHAFEATRAYRLATPDPHQATEAVHAEPNAFQKASRFGIPLFLGIALSFPLLIYLIQGGLDQSRYWVDLGILILTYVMLGWGLNIVVGLAGLLDLGYVAFYAVGAYSYALLSTTFGLSFWVCLPACRHPGGVLGHHPGLPGAAPAGRLSRHRDAGIRRDRPPRADQLDRPHQWRRRHLVDPPGDLLRPALHGERGRFRGFLRASSITACRG